MRTDPHGGLAPRGCEPAATRPGSDAASPPGETVDAATERYEQYLPSRRRKGVGLCLSGGGLRATLFHLGAFRRLSELGITPQLRTVSAVSGGSLFALILADALARAPLTDYDAQVAAPVRRLATLDLRRRLLVRRFGLRNLLGRRHAIVEILADELETRVSSLRLPALPAVPNVVFCATDLAFGVNWVFERNRMGDYVAGYISDPQHLEAFPAARAVAASACFPPFFNPLPVRFPPAAFQGYRTPPPKEWADCLQDLRLNDGGTYDNMGTEPVWKSHATVLVSDGGQPFPFRKDPGLVRRVLRYPDVVQSQARALRKRWLIAGFASGRGSGRAMEGTYWGIGGARTSYVKEDTRGYSKDLARTVIARLRTDLNAFTDAEAAVLENHGYLLADAAIMTHARALAPADPPPLRVPHPDWIDETRVREALSPA